MLRRSIKTNLFLLTGIFILMCSGLTLASCQGKTSSPTPSATETFRPTSTLTHTPTITQTSTLANTITPLPSFTPTVTLTPYPTLTSTPSPTVVALQPAVLFPYTDVSGKLVDWSYFHITQKNTNHLGEVDDLWAFMAFQLLDRGIHQRNFTFLGEPITVYYLNVAHEFDGELLPLQLVLGGTPGKDVPLQNIPAGGTAYVQAQVWEASQRFNPYLVHRDANRDYELRDSAYPLLFIKDLQALLAELPDEVILLADHPILFPRGSWPQIKLDMSRISYLAARYQPFFDIDDYDRLTGQSEFAYALRDLFLDQKPVQPGFYAYSSQTLIIITGTPN